MPKTCIRCTAPYRVDRKSDICKTCASICDCGVPKDFRASNCRSCASTLGALLQWATNDKAIRLALELSGEKRRTTYKDLTFGSFTMTKCDGRKFGRYWKANGKLAYIYRYRWVWEQAFGDIPGGMVIHHVDGDCTNDVIENLQLMSASEHSSLHMTRHRAQDMIRKRYA